nr:ATP-binding SpoIIE family protein phosphatase [Streptomyces sp. S1D4-11]QIZ00737.1 SpoIIE family protein phosphatase [Streptomyces sp. S1D4-11]
MNAKESPLTAETNRLPCLSALDAALSVTTREFLCAEGASAVGVYFPSPDTDALRAALITVTSTGMGAIEEVPLTEDIFPSARAYKYGKTAIGHSYDHSNLATLSPFLYAIAAAPISCGNEVFGTLTAYWIGDRVGNVDHLSEVARQLGSELANLTQSGSLPVPPTVPAVFSADTDNSLSIRTPIIFHLHRLAGLLNEAPNTQAATKLAIERVVAGFGASAVAITLIDGDRLIAVGAFGCTHEYVKSLNGTRLSASTPEAKAIAKEGLTVFTPGDPRTSDRWVGEAEGIPCSWVVLPLTAATHPVGVCSLGFANQSLANEPLVWSSLASMLGQTLERTRSNEARYELARNLQEELLPRYLPQFPGILSVNRYRPASAGIDVGGDWYDVIELPDGKIAMVIGDVEGHNAEAAVVMGQLRSAVRAYAAEGHGPAAVLARTNMLLAGLHSGVFATCCCVCLDPETGQAQIATAGHPLPLVRTPDGKFLQPNLEVDSPLGVTSDAEFTSGELTLTPGTLLTLYTDGLADANGLLTRSAFEAALSRAGLEMESLADFLMEGSEKFPTRKGDDAALLLVCYEGQPKFIQQNVRGLKIHRRDLQGARLARHLLRKWLQDWHLEDLTDDAELLVSEVVTNGLIHGDSDVSFCVRRYTDHLRVEVRDSDPRPAHTVAIRPSEDQEEGGRGLRIVMALATAWGNSPAGRGKTVWFELPRTAHESHAASHFVGTDALP